MNEVGQENLTPLSTPEWALSRARLYRLIADLFRFGLTEETCRELDVLQLEDLPAPSSQSFDDLAAEHFELFDLQLPPCESLYRDPSGLLGGHYENQVREIAAACQCDFFANDLPADHLANELLILAELCRNEFELYGSADRNDQSIFNQQRFQRHWLESTLLHWIHPYATGLLIRRDPFYSALAEIALELIESHHASLTGIDVACRTEPSDTRFSQNDELVNDEADNLNGPAKLAEWLSLPVKCGWHLSKSEIGGIARRLNLTAGFTHRAGMLQNLLESAIKFDRLDACLGRLREISQAHGDRHRARIEARPELAPFLNPWLDRLETTGRVLDSIEIQFESKQENHEPG